MATIKSHSDLEQSRKLAEFLPLESADMYYQYVIPKSDKVKHNPEIGNPINALEWYNKGYTLGGKEPIKLDEYCVPAWSLSALINVLPDTIEDDVGVLFGLNIKKNFVEYYNPSMGALYATYHSVNAETLVDACYDMIIKLHEKKIL